MRAVLRLGLAGVLLAAMSGSAPAAAAGLCRFTPTVARPSNVFDRLVGLTTDQRGIGGTGVVAQREERGLGGTGIIGVVTGFGSICVNGFEVDLPKSTPVSVAGLPAAAGDLRLGQVVVLEAYPDGAGLRAARVDVAVAVAGPVTAIGPDGASLTVAGQRVTAAGFGGSAGTGGIHTGDWVVVSGLRRTDDSIAGSSIVKLARRGRQVFLSGMTRAASGAVEIGDLVIATPTITAGEAVAVRGTLSGATLQAQAVEVESASPFSRPMATVSVQGYATRIDSDLQRLGITPPPAPADAPSNAVVQVDGSFATGGSFAPARVGTPPPPVDRAQPSPPPTRPANAAPVQTPPAAPAQPPAPPPDRPAAPPDQQRPPTPDVQRPDRPAPPVRPTIPDVPRPPQRPDPPPRPE